MFVVHLMCPTDGPQITILRVREHLDTLMDEEVVYKEIGRPIEGHPCRQTHKSRPETERPQPKARHGDGGEEDKKDVVPFKEGMSTLLRVMISMKDPPRTMHDVSMHEPSHTFHGDERDDDGSDDAYHDSIS